MNCYEIWVRSNKYHSSLPLTYTSPVKLSAGTIVKIDLRNQSCVGIIRRAAPAPKGVAMKPISDTFLDGSHHLPIESLKLLSWLLLYYPSGSGQITQLFLPPSWPRTEDIYSTNPKENNNKLATPPILTSEQTNILQSIQTNPGSFILHGDTGTGKTRVYLELISKTISSGRSCMILVPEIGLAPHLYSNLAPYLDTNIQILHSGLLQIERRKTWTQILTNPNPQIIIGTRSALFAPMINIGLIVVDECHDDGYKQENTPKYHGLRVASRLAQLHDSTLIFGSATPSISDLYIAQEKKIPILRMTKLATKNNKNSRLLLINRRDNKEFTQSNFLSNTLIKELHKQLKTGRQSLLFLNRRGSAKIVACTECGWRDLCSSCELPLTFHEDKFILRCHTCGRSEKTPTSCPDCNNTNIIYSGPGTKKVENEIQKLFPGAVIARFDKDNLTQDRLDKKLPHIQNNQIDIIIGTQILIKGFDIPNLGLVGILDADSSLSFPDFTTDEKTYQILTQTIGRVGRGHTDSVAVIQTLQPESKLLAQVMTKNWEQFYNQQIKVRQEHKFPPFTFLLKLEYSKKKYENVIKSTEKLKTLLLDKYPGITLLGPSPAFKEKRGGTYTWQLIVKSSRRSILLQIVKSLPSGWKYDIDPTHLL